MSEPLTWNTLPGAAAWLSERCGRTLDARSVIDAVIQRSERGATIIKAPVPTDCSVARIAFSGKMPDAEQVQFEHQRLEQQHGPLGTGMLYVRNEHPRVHCLCASELTDLLLHGAIDVSLVRAPNDSQGDTIGAWLMPWGTKRTVSLDACGINRADLVALGDELAAGTPPQAAAPEPKAASEWQTLAQQRAREIVKAHKEKDWFAEFSERGEHVTTATTSRTHAAKLLAGESTYPKGRKPADVFDLLRKAERAGQLVRVMRSAENRHQKEVWEVTPQGRELAELPPFALTALTCADFEVSATGEVSALTALTSQGVRGKRAHKQVSAPAGAETPNGTPDCADFTDEGAADAD